MHHDVSRNGATINAGKGGKPTRFVATRDIPVESRLGIVRV